MTRLSLVVVLLASLPIAAQPGADGCKDIKKGDAAKCAEEAAAKCGAIEGYWDKVNCEKAIAAEHNLCGGPAHLAACAKPAEDYWEVCRKAEELDMNRAESIEAWRRRALTWKAANEEMKAFSDEWIVCEGASPECPVTPSWVSDCAGAQAKFKAKLAEEVDFFLQAGLAQGISRIDDAVKAGNFSGALQWIELTSASLEAFRGLNAELPEMKHRAAELDAAAAKLKKSTAKAKKGYAKALAGRKCPAVDGLNGKMTAAMKPKADAFFRGTGDTKSVVKAFRLGGAVKTESKPVIKLTKESIAGVACVQKTTKVETYCRRYNVTMRRQKYADHPWSDWRVFVGDSERIPCSAAK